MHFLILLLSRLIRVVANLTKVFSYLFHWFFPKKRFTMPRARPALIPSRKQGRIPRIIWQTNYTDRATLPVYLNYLFNRLISPTWEYRFHLTEDRRVFISQHYDADVLACYDRLQIGAAQADFWRVLVLNKMGGVYLDIDAHMLRPLEFVLSPQDDEAYVKTRRGDLSNYFIASRPGNPNMARIADGIARNIRHPPSNNVFDITGPGVFNTLLDQSKIKTCLYKFTCAQGTFTNEYFQYLDKKEGKWTKQQHVTSVVGPEAESAVQSQAQTGLRPDA